MRHPLKNKTANTGVLPAPFQSSHRRRRESYAPRRQGVHTKQVNNNSQQTVPRQSVAVVVVVMATRRCVKCEKTSDVIDVFAATHCLLAVQWSTEFEPLLKNWDLYFNLKNIEITKCNAIK